MGGLDSISLEKNILGHRVHSAKKVCNRTGTETKIVPSQAVRAAANGHPAPRPEAFPVGLSREAFSLAAGMVRRLRLDEAAVPRSGARRRGGGEEGRLRSTVTGREREVDGRGDDESGGDDGGNGCGGERGGGGSGGEEMRVGSLRVESWESGQPMVEGFLKKRR